MCVSLKVNISSGLIKYASRSIVVAAAVAVRIVIVVVVVVVIVVVDPWL